MARGIDLLPVIIPGEIIEQERHYQEATRDPGKDPAFIVIVYNDDVHTFPEVEAQLQKATGCTLEKAEALSFEIDSRGKAVVFAGSAEECERVASILREIRLQVETDRA